MDCKTRNITIQLILLQCCKTAWMFFAARFSVPVRRTDKGAKLENKLIYHATGVVSNSDAYTRSFLTHLSFIGRCRRGTPERHKKIIYSVNKRRL